MTATVKATTQVNDAEARRLIELAQASDALDASLTVRQAVRKYPKAVFWSMILSLALVMEGYDLVMINSFFGQTQFQQRFGDIDGATPGSRALSAPWQSGLTNSALVGQMAGLVINAFAQDRFGSRITYIAAMIFMMAAIFIPVFAPNLSVLAFGEAMCGIPWGIFQTLSTSYASEVVPTVLRPQVTAFVCMCWGGGILMSAGVVRGCTVISSEWAWRLPFCLQWIWPIPLAIFAYLAPESPWNAVRRGKLDVARTSIARLRSAAPDSEEVEANLAYVRHVTTLEAEETSGASFFDCFRGTNLRRTEINCVVWAAQILCGNAILGYSVVFLQAAGFGETQSLDLNIALSACYIIGGVICWFLFPRMGRSTIYMAGMAIMLVGLIVIGGLAFSDSKEINIAIGVIFIFQTLVNMSTIGPACYPIVAETPSGKLRYKTIVIGRFIYNCTGVFSNILTPRMVNASAWGWAAHTAWFYAGTNALCLIWCWLRLPETKDRSFGEIDMLFEAKVPARKFKSTKVDQFSTQESDGTDEKKLDTDHVEKA